MTSRVNSSSVDGAGVNASETPKKRSSAIESAIAENDPIAVLTLAVEQSFLRLREPLTDAEVRQQGLQFAAALAALADSCGVNLATLTASCWCVLVVSLERYCTREQIDQVFFDQRNEIEELSKFRTAQDGRVM